MKKFEIRLIHLASKLQQKYAQSQGLQEIIQNAALWGEQSANGIMNFPEQLKHDQADLSISVNVSTGFGGGYNITVGQPIVNPAQFVGNYVKLPGQIKNYLERHTNDFPQLLGGSATLRYSGKTPSTDEIADQ